MELHGFGLRRISGHGFKVKGWRLKVAVHGIKGCAGLPLLEVHGY